MARIYVAGASKQIERAKDAIRSLRAAGHEITHDWTREVEASRAQGHSDATYPQDLRLACAHADYCGVLNAEVVVLLLPPAEATSKGMWVELGIALGAEHQPYVVVSGDASQSIFCELADAVFPSDFDDCVLITHFSVDDVFLRAYLEVRRGERDVLRRSEKVA